MFALTPQHRFFLYRHWCDMRKGFDGLSGIVRNELNADPLSGDVFVFINRSRTTMKLLIFENDGYLLYHKRLEAGRFQNLVKNQTDDDIAAEVIDYHRLELLIQGVDLYHLKYRKRYKKRA
jgi:hypothetical protein|tara:strand:+ start:439 stop:801 length:363 start_codon:yes stop_codon:yes gene_type:complete